MATRLKFSLVTIPSNKSIACRGEHDWEDAGRPGQYFGKILLGQWWAIVKWDDEEDPTMVKAAAIELFVPPAPRPAKWVRA